MQRSSIKKFLLVPLFLLLAMAAAAQTINYQGVITSDSGLVTGHITVMFRIYTTQEGGTPIWSETQEVTVEKGIFRTVLGSVRPLTGISRDSSYWFSVTLDGRELSRTDLFGSVRRAPVTAEAQGGHPSLPEKINYQGMISNDDLPIEGKRDMIFRIYDAREGGKLLWSETQSVMVSQGLFSVMLGSVNPLSKLPPAPRYWFSMTLDNQELDRTEFVLPNAGGGN